MISELQFDAWTDTKTQIIYSNLFVCVSFLIKLVFVCITGVNGRFRGLVLGLGEREACGEQ